MRAVAFGLFVLAAIAGTARAGRGKPPPDLVPYGTDWSCFHARDASAATEPPRCERTETACRVTLATLAEPAKMTGCAPQETATVVTYYDSKRATWRFLASPDDDGCLALRGGLAATKAFQRVSQCEVVGKRFPPPAKLATAAITPGKGWWCFDLPEQAPSTARAACFRAVGGCEDAIRRDAPRGTKCKQRPTAYLVTFHDKTTGWAFVASANNEACASYRERLVTAFAADDVSACAAIGEVARPKLDRRVLPKGRGWHCYTGADASHPLGRCARAASECAGMYELDRYVLGNSDGCKAQSSASARSTSDQVLVFPNAALCEANILDHPDGSRCEEVR